MRRLLPLAPRPLPQRLPRETPSANRAFDYLDGRLPATPWLGLDDLPDSTYVDGTDPDRWHLFATDQRGYAYYAPTVDAPDGIAVYAHGNWQQYDEFLCPPNGSTTRDICDRIADLHCLAALPGDVVDAITGGGEP